MPIYWTDRRLATFSAVALLGLAVCPAFAQKGAGAPSTGAGTSSGTTGSRSPVGSIPSSFPNSTSTNSTTPSMTRPIFLSGKVMFDDGTQPSGDIRIERVCGGIPRLESHTDSKGRFSFQLGQNATVDTDAADPSAGGVFGRPDGPLSSTGGMAGANGPSSNQLWNCELRAAYPGYRSDVVELATRKSLDDPDLGTIFLHRLSNVQGTTISLTSAMAPRHAQKDYEKGIQLARKGKFEEAEKQLLDATDTYPKYAVAWFALGQVQQKQGEADNARKSYQAAIAADAKFVSPYDQLALLAAKDRKWQDTADYSKQVIQLNPVEFPNAFWYNAVANYNLKKPADAEKSVRELLKLDARKFPDAEEMLGQLLLEKGNYPEAAGHLRAYLALAPNAKNAEAVKEVLAKIDPANEQAKK